MSNSVLQEVVNSNFVSFVFSFYWTVVQQMHLTYCTYMYSLDCLSCYVFPRVHKVNKYRKFSKNNFLIPVLLFKGFRDENKYSPPQDPCSRLLWPAALPQTEVASVQWLGELARELWLQYRQNTGNTQLLIFATSNLDSTTSRVSKCLKEIGTSLKNVSLRQTQGKKEALQWGMRNRKMFFDITKAHLQLCALRPPRRPSSPSLLKAYEHADIIITHQINVWQATDQAMAFRMVFFTLNFNYFHFYIQEQSLPFLNCYMHTPRPASKTFHPLQATLQSITATTPDIRAENLRHAPRVRP